MRFPQPRDLGRGAFSNRKEGGKEGGDPSVSPISLQPREDHSSETSRVPWTPLGHPIPPLKDRLQCQGNEEGSSPLPPGSRMRKFPCKCQADHRHRASHQGDKCKFLWRRRGSSQGPDTDRGFEKELPTHFQGQG